MVAVFRWNSSFYSLRQGLSLELGLTISARPAGPQTPRTRLSPSPSTEIIDIHRAAFSYVGTGELNSHREDKKNIVGSILSTQYKQPP